MVAVNETSSQHNASKMMPIVFSIFLVFVGTALVEWQDGRKAESSILESVTTLFKTTGVDRQYDFSSHLNPSFLRGDFDGDGKPDIAILVRQKKSGKIGIAVCHSSNKILVVGAGTEVGNGGDNFDWMDIWNVTPKATAAKKVGKATAALLKGDTLDVEKSESASALIYWNGRRFVWRQQSD